MNEEGIGCDNITCTIVAICDNLNKNEAPLKKVQMVKKKSKQITENCDMDLRIDYERLCKHLKNQKIFNLSLESVLRLRSQCHSPTS